MRIMSRRTLWLGIAVLAATPSVAFGQQASAQRSISLDEAIAEALQGNAGLAIARAGTDGAHADAKQASS